MKSEYLTYGPSQIHYLQAGNGPELLVCLHGYGESSSSFRILEHLLPPAYTLYALDLPYHGFTSWKGPAVFSPAMLQSIIDQLSGGSPVSLIGYSMGGRIALSLLQYRPAAVKQLVLLAPDGLHRHSWYWLSTQNWLGKRLFRYSVNHPGWLFGLLQLGKATGLVKATVRRLVHYYLDDEQQRHLLYKRWTAMYLFNPNLHEIKKGIRAHQIPVELLFGRYDEIIRSNSGYRFVKGLEAFAHVRETEAGHQLLKEKYAAEIAGLLKNAS